MCALLRRSAVRHALASVAIAALNACAGATEPEVAEEPTIYDVRISFDSIAVFGSCDHNSIFEDPNDGEFDFTMSASDTRTGNVLIDKKLSVTLLEAAAAALPSSWYAVSRRDLSLSTAFTVKFGATEKDGILGADPDMNKRENSKRHDWMGTYWSEPTSIALYKSADCGVNLIYSIKATPLQ